MRVIITKPVKKLKSGEISEVKDGYARNFLLPKGFALKATQENQQKLDALRQELVSKHLDDHKHALLQQSKLDGKTLVFVSQALEDGKLFGSITAKQITRQLKESDNLDIRSEQVSMQGAIKNIGVHRVSIFLHPEVSINIIINIARTESEAASQILQFKTEEDAAKDNKTNDRTILDKANSTQ
jgi:large subunit ribosomal protein L9